MTQSIDVGADAGLTRAEAVEAARAIALRQLTMAPRTRSELLQKLGRKKVPEDVATEVVDRLEEVGLVNDRDLAFAFVAARSQVGGLGRQRISQKLRQRGVDPELIQEALGTIDSETQTEAAVVFAEKRWQRTRGLPLETRRRRLLGQMQRRGYSSGDCHRAMAAVVANEDEGRDFI